MTYGQQAHQPLPASLGHRCTFIDVYAGCGGLSLGLFSAGWQGLFAVEKDEDAFRTLSHNLLAEGGKYSYSWPEWLPRQAHNISTLTRKYRKELEALRGKVDLLAGGPPCQGFSFCRKKGQKRPSKCSFPTLYRVGQDYQAHICSPREREGDNYRVWSSDG